MAKALATANDSTSSKPQGKITVPVASGQAITGIGSSIGRLRQFLLDVRSEMRKVVTPSRAEVQATTTVVIVTVFAFAGYFYLVDSILGRGIQEVLKWMGASQ